MSIKYLFYSRDWLPVRFNKIYGRLFAKKNFEFNSSRQSLTRKREKVTKRDAKCFLRWEQWRTESKGPLRALFSEGIERQRVKEGKRNERYFWYGDRQRNYTTGALSPRNARVTYICAFHRRHFSETAHFPSVCRRTCRWATVPPLFSLQKIIN